MTTVALQLAIPIVRAGVVSRFDSIDGVRLLADAPDLTSLLTLVDALTEPLDVLVLECDTAEGSIDAHRVADIQRRVPGVGIIGLHSDLPALRITELRRMGMRCIVDRSSGVDALIAAVLDPNRPTRRRWSAPTIGPLPLTDRESQVLGFIAEGRTAKEIAAELGISCRTVEAHKQRAFLKLGVQNQAHAVSAALRGKQLRTPSVVDGRSLGPNVVSINVDASGVAS